MLLGVLPAILPQSSAHAAAAAYLADEIGNTEITVDVDEEFSVVLYVADITRVAGYECKITVSGPATPIGSAVHGDWFADGHTVFDGIDPAPADYNTAMLLSPAAISGSGAVVVFTLHADEEGSVAINVDSEYFLFAESDGDVIELSEPSTLYVSVLEGDGFTGGGESESAAEFPAEANEESSAEASTGEGEEPLDSGDYTLTVQSTQVSVVITGTHTNPEYPYGTPYTAGVNANEVVTLEAPVAQSGYGFHHWTIGGTPAPTGEREVTFTITGDLTAEAVYRSATFVPDDYATIQQAISNAAQDTVVIVRNGTYSGTGNWDIDFMGKRLLVRSETKAEECIIDCSDGANHHRGFNFVTGETRDSVLYGFTIRNGNAPEEWGTSSGGAIYCYDSSPTIAFCKFEDNTSPGEFGGYGGAIYASVTSIQIRQNVFTGNSATTGGAIYCRWLVSVLITGNEFTSNNGSGAAISSGEDYWELGGDFAAVEGNTFTANGNTSQGSAVSGMAYVRMNTFIGNYGASGGAANLSDGDFIGNIVIGNTATNVYGGGGGVYCSSGGITVADNDIVGNVAREGGGIHAGAYTAITGNRIIGNSTVTNELYYGNGGGIYATRATITGNIIAGNAARNSNVNAQPSGGGIFVAGGSAYSGSIIGNVIVWNLAEYGGGIGCSNFSPQIVGNKIMRNHAGYFGGGMDIRDFSNPLVSNNLVAQNSAGLGGGGLWFQNINAEPDEEPLVINNTIVQNSAGGGLPDYVGGGIGCYSGGAANIVNCILWGNVCGNGSQLGIADNSKAIVSHSDLAGGQGAVYVRYATLVWQAGNIAADPLFVGPGDYRLDWQSNPISPCIDKCTTGPSIDIRGHARPFDGDGVTNDEYDMGAYEMQGNDTESTVIYVDDGLGETIQDAIDAAKDGTTIIVRDGTYTGTGNYDITCRGKALTIQSENGPESCIIDCQQHARGFRFEGETSATIIEGFTIRNGFADYGGAVYCANASPIVRNCIMKNNSATRRGGAMYIAGGGSPVVANTLIAHNRAEKEPEAVDEARGGGIAFAGFGLGAPGTVELMNLTIADNTAYTGGGVCLESSASVLLENCILWENESTSSTGQEEAALYSSSILTLKYSDMRGGNQQLVSDGCTLNWNSAPAVGNIDSDPLFGSSSQADYHLMSKRGRWRESVWIADEQNSPCIDTGDPNQDYDLEPAPNGSRINMGAYGGTAQASKSVSQFDPTITAFLVKDQSTQSQLFTNEATVAISISAQPYEGRTIAAYIVKQGAEVPALDDPAWTSSVTSFTLTADPGTEVELYGWAKDDQGNLTHAKAWILYDTRTPSVTGISVTAGESGTATVTWSTDLLAEGQVRYGPVKMDGSTPNTSNEGSLEQSHSVAITGLQAGTNYKVVLVNNEVASSPFYWPNRWPIDGDADQSCRVNILDMILIRSKLNQPVNVGDNWKADLNADSRINILDMIYVRKKLNTQCP